MQTFKRTKFGYDTFWIIFFGSILFIKKIYNNKERCIDIQWYILHIYNSYYTIFHSLLRSYANNIYFFTNILGLFISWNNFLFKKKEILILLQSI